MSAHEMLDLVDERDVVIGEVERGATDADPTLIHREIIVLLHDAQHRVLLQQRGQKKTVRPGYWTISCAGHVPKGMEPIAAAHMELQEELGFDVPLRFVKKFLDRMPTHTRFAYLFIGEYAGQPIVIQAEEVAQTKLVTEAEYRVLLKGAPVTEGSQELVEAFWSGTLLRGVR